MQQKLLSWLRKPYGIITGCALCTGITVGTIEDLRHWAIAKASAAFSAGVTAQQACIDQYLGTRTDTVEGPYLIILTDLVNDQDQTQTRLVDQNLRGLYGQDRTDAIQVESIPCAIYATGGNAADRYEGGKIAALKIAARTKADVVIWGEVVESDSKIALSMTYATDTTASDYKVEQKALGTDFGTDIGALVAVKMLTLVDVSTEDSGGFLVDRMRKVETLAAPLLANFPKQMAKEDQADLFLADGIAKYYIGRQTGDVAELNAAVDAFQGAMHRYDQSTPARDWSVALTNFGSVLQELGDRDSNSVLLEQSVDAFRAALATGPRDDEALGWAIVQNNLGNALSSLGRFNEAVVAYNAALEVRTREKVPLNWAATQNNLAGALTELGRLEGGTARFEQAVKIRLLSLEEYRRDLVPLDWAMAQHGLGLAYHAIGEDQEGTLMLDKAVEAYENALSERTKDRVPIDWAQTTSNLAAVHVTYFYKTGDVAWLDSAVDLLNSARIVFEDNGATNYVQIVDSILARIADARP